MNRAYAEGRTDEAESQWRPIETAPEDENVLVATQGGWVDTAFWTDEDGEGRKWWWLVSANEHAKHPIHPNLIPTHWMPLPKHPSATIIPERPPGVTASGVAWLASTEDVSDKDAEQAVLTGRSIPEIQADIAAQRERIAGGVKEG